MSPRRSLGFIAALIGLIALLVVPFVAHHRAEAVHQTVEQTVQPAHELANRAVELAREARGVAVASYMGVPELPANLVRNSRELYDALLLEWMELEYRAEALKACGGNAYASWRVGRSDVTTWLQEYGPRYLDAGSGHPSAAPPLSKQEIRNANFLFQRGVDHLRDSRHEIEAFQGRLHNQLVGINSQELIVTIPLGVLCLLLAGAAWRTVHQLQRSETRLQLAIKETNHRVKNNLQVVSALLDVRRMDTPDPHIQSAMREVARQVEAMASVHDLLSTSRSEGTVTGDSLINRLTGLISKTASLTIENRAEPVALSTKQASAVALITTELLLNSGKHGASHAVVCLTNEGPSALLSVQDDGPGFPSGFDVAKDSNLGLSLVETLARHDLRGTVDFPDGGGSEIRVTFPVAR